MPSTPQEGDGKDSRSLGELRLDSFGFEVNEWTDGQITVQLLLSTKSARYRVPLSMSEFLLLLVKGNETLAGILKRQKLGK